MVLEAATPSSHSTTATSALRRFRLQVLGAGIIVFFLITTLLLQALLPVDYEDNNLLTRASRIRRSAAQVVKNVAQDVASLRGESSTQARSVSDFSFLSNKIKKDAGVAGEEVHVTYGSDIYSYSKKSNRAVFENDHTPDDVDRIAKTLIKLRVPSPQTHKEDIPYDIYNCPETPPLDYPFQWNLVDKVLRDWNPDITGIPERIYNGICIFDWNDPNQRSRAEKYRIAEVPVVLQNYPEILKAAERWNHPQYLQNLIGREPQRNEYSKNNHFMFWRTRKFDDTPRGWKAPTKNVELPFDQWYKRAQQLQALKGETTKQERWYFRLNGEIGRKNKNAYLYDELPFFRPDKPSFFMIDPSDARGINCRMGMKGIIAECHFDSSRNWIVVMGGQRRYVLAHPKQCKYLELYDRSHPSGRHSLVNWSTATRESLEKEGMPQFLAIGTYDSSDEGSNSTSANANSNNTLGKPRRRPFLSAKVNEVVMQAGDALYLPDSWMHFIVSLGISYQCNARSGQTPDYHDDIGKCGFW